jgi:hypothetical protein
MSDRPTGLKATKGIELLTWGTPNGVKASIILEELKEAYGMVRLQPHGRANRTDRYGRTILGRESILDKTFRRSPGSPSLVLMEESP